MKPSLKQIVHILGHKKSLNKDRDIKIISYSQSTFHNKTKLKINSQKKCRIHRNLWRPNGTPLNDKNEKQIKKKTKEKCLKKGVKIKTKHTQDCGILLTKVLNISMLTLKSHTHLNKQYKK